MTLREASSRFGPRDALLLIPCALFVALFIYDLDTALRAPICRSPAELGIGCLPLGWEGPFSDNWSNRSRSHAMIGAAANLGLGLVTVAACVALLIRKDRKLIIPLQIGLVLALILKSLMLNDFS